jgi:hypothetical protein
MSSAAAHRPRQSTPPPALALIHCLIPCPTPCPSLRRRTARTDLLPIHLPAILALLAAAALGLAGCAGSDSGPGLSGTRVSISECMEPAAARSRDVQRNLPALRGQPICYRRQEVREGGFDWVFHLLEHRKTPDGPFWVLPHDNEDTAFDAAVDALIRYGGGLLAVDSGGQRQFRGQDPNRNFSSTTAESRLCRSQRKPAPAFTAAILRHHQGHRGPYLALHNNHDGWSGNGGRGTISIHRRAPMLSAYPSSRAAGQLRDEDNLIYMAGLRAPTADAEVRGRIAALNAAGLNVVYKQVTDTSFDCSLSDYIARHRLGDYYNLEAEFGQRAAQQEMIDRLMQTLAIKAPSRPRASPFLGG